MNDRVPLKIKKEHFHWKERKNQYMQKNIYNYAYWFCNMFYPTAISSTNMLTRAPTGGGGYPPPPEVFRRYRENRGAQRREIWHDYSFIIFTHYVQVLTS